MSDLARENRRSVLRRFVERLARLAVNGADHFFLEPEVAAFDRIYGGQSLAEALTAAAQTVEPNRRMSSVHCYFLRLGDPTQPVSFTVRRLRDTRSFSLRQVSAEQQGQAIIDATFSFASPSLGIEHQWTMPDTPPPDTLISRDVELIQRYGGKLPPNAGVPWPFDLRHVDRRPWDDHIGNGCNRVWMRVDESLADDPVLHASLLLFASDLTMTEAVTAQHPIVWEDLIAGRGHFGASLDHAFWLHAPVRVDQWLLHVQESSRAASGRGLTTGRFFDQAGNLVASVAQEFFLK